MLSVQARQTYSMRTSDGVRLDADVYFPEGEGPFPVLLMRQPYGRAIASTIVYAHPQWYAAHGYIVVIQDVRGRGSSEGVFDLFAYEVSDGGETVAWAAELPGSDGQVGMYGFSYQGMTQLYAAEARLAALKTIAPAMTGYHLYEDWATENGALYFQLGLMWALQLAAETARIRGDVVSFDQLLQAAHQLPVRDPIPVCPKVLSGVSSFFHDWVKRPPTDGYWQRLIPQLSEVDLPMLHIGGWFDPYLRGDLRLYREMAARSQYCHHFWVGPWGHIPWARKVGAVDFGPAAASPVDRLQIRWFDAILKGKDKRGLMAERPVCLFEMGRNQWRQFADWPDEVSTGPSREPKSREPKSREPKSRELTYYLHSEGLSHIRADSGVLALAASSQLAYDTLVHDPWNPAPALGGHSAVPAGSFERTAIDMRGDVLTYTSLPLESELRIAGVPRVRCAIATESVSYDLCAVLSRVTQQGEAYNLTQGYRRVDAAIANPPKYNQLTPNLVPKGSEPVDLPLHPTCFSLFPGECLRLSLSAACFPAYAINAGTGLPLAQSRLIDAQIITLVFEIGAESGSVLHLPIGSDQMP